MPLMQTFDSLVCEESRPRRRMSVTALQSLAMYNGEFVNEEAKFFANRVAKLAPSDPTKQIRQAFELALGRHPEQDEVEQLLKLLESPRSARSGGSSGGFQPPKQQENPPGKPQTKPQQSGLVRVCRVLLNTNEFIYVD